MFWTGVLLLSAPTQLVWLFLNIWIQSVHILCRDIYVNDWQAIVGGYLSL
jgi:hypothetical protein